MDRLQTGTSPGSSVVGYRYDLDGNRTKVIYPDSTAVTYTFDKASRLTGLTDWASRGTSYAYVPDGHVQQVTNVNGTIGQYSYDNAQRLTQVLNKQSGGAVIDQHTYTLDSVGTRTQVAETLAQVGGGQITPTTSYSYDKLYELTADGSTSYSYDPVGNRSTMGSTSYSYDKADRITSAGSISYTVNANGNVTARGSDSFGYDQANRLKSATVSGTTTTNAFDGDGKRATQAVGANPAITYRFDTNRSLPVVLTDGALKYVWGLGLLYAVDGSGNLQVFHADGVASTRALTDGTATLIDTYRTDAFGNPTASQGSSTQPLRFAGEQLDSDGLVYLRARFYDAGTGRLLERDPLAGASAMPVALNRYSYALNSPLVRADPSGLATSRLLRPLPAYSPVDDGSAVGTAPEPDPGGYVLGAMATPPPTPTVGDIIQPLQGTPVPYPEPPPYSARGSQIVLDATEMLLTFGLLTAGMTFLLFPPADLAVGAILLTEVGMAGSALGFASASTELFHDIFGG